MTVSDQRQLVSVLIPCFNTAAFLPRCLNSVLNSSLAKDSYNIICYNDGSSDRTLEILQSYASKYENIQVISNDKNNGVSYSRQRLIEQVKTPYFYHCDSDDFINHDTLQTLLQIANVTNADIVFSRALYYCEKKRPRPFWYNKRTRFIKNIGQYIDKNLLYIWNILISTNFYQKTKFIFPDFYITFGEDLLAVSYLALLNPKISVCHKYTYNYVKNPTSLMNDHNKILANINDGIEVLKLILEASQNVKLATNSIYLANITNNAMFVALTNTLWLTKKLKSRKIRQQLNIDSNKPQQFRQEALTKIHHLAVKFNINLSQWPRSWWKKMGFMFIVRHTARKLKKQTISTDCQ